MKVIDEIEKDENLFEDIVFQVCYIVFFAMSEDDEIGQATRETRKQLEAKSIKTVRDAAAVVLPENVTSSDFIFAVDISKSLSGKNLLKVQMLYQYQPPL